MHVLRNLAISFVLACGLAGCGKGDLSRSSAKDMLLASKEVQALSKTVTLSTTAGEKANSLGIIEPKLIQSPLGSRQYEWVLSAKGKKLFSAFDGREATLVQPIALPVIEVTGITNIPLEENGREVQFNLTQQYSPEIKRLAAYIHSGKATFRRYDDGWRLESASIGERFLAGGLNREPYPLTNQEKYDEQVEVAAVSEERGRHKANLQMLVEKSKIPNQEILRYQTGDLIVQIASKQDVQEFVLYDTEIYVAPIPVFGGIGGAVHIWLGDFMKFDNGEYPEPPFCGEKILYRGNGGVKQASYNLNVRTNRNNVYRFYFARIGDCQQLRQKFEETLQAWSTKYGPALNELVGHR